MKNISKKLRFLKLAFRRDFDFEPFYRDQIVLKY